MFLQEKQKYTSIISYVLLVLFAMTSIILGSGILQSTDNNIASARENEPLLLENYGFETQYNAYLESNVLMPQSQTTEPYLRTKKNISELLGDDWLDFGITISFIYRDSPTGQRLLGANSTLDNVSPIITIDILGTVRLSLPYADKSGANSMFFKKNASSNEDIVLNNMQYYVFMMYYNSNNESFKCEIYTPDPNDENLMVIVGGVYSLPHNIRQYYPTQYDVPLQIGKSGQSWGDNDKFNSHILPYIALTNGFDTLSASEDTIFEDALTAYNRGSQKGVSIGYGIGYDKGFSDGTTSAGTADYQQGINDKKSTFEGFISVIEAPFAILKNAFSFEIFGINVASVIAFLLTATLVVFVISKFKE